MERSEDFQNAARECVALARKTTNPQTRAALLLMAQSWMRRMDEPPDSKRFDAILQDFNDRQMNQHYGR